MSRLYFHGNSMRSHSQADRHGDLNTTNTSPRVKQYNIHWRDELRKQKTQWKKQAHLSAAKKGLRVAMDNGLPNGYGTPTEKTFTLPTHRDPGTPAVLPPARSPYGRSLVSKQAVLKQSNQKVNTLKELIRDEAENIGLTPTLKDQTAVTINLIMNPDAMQQQNGVSPAGAAGLPNGGSLNINTRQLYGRLRAGGPRITDLTDDDDDGAPRRRVYHKPSRNFERRLDESLLVQDQVRAEDSVSQVSTVSGARVPTPDHLKRYSAKHQLTPIKVGN